MVRPKAKSGDDFILIGSSQYIEGAQHQTGNKFFFFNRDLQH